jgi:integrase
VTRTNLRIVQAEEIHPGTAAALRALWLAQGRPEAGLVNCEATGEPVDPDRYSRRFRELCADAELPALSRIHNVRHSLATALEAAGVPAHEAAALLGHDVDTYRRFYLVTDNTGAAAAARAAGRISAVTG